MSLSKAEILKADDTKVLKVSVPEWGGHVYVKNMSGTERDSFEASVVSGTPGNNGSGQVNLRNIRARLACLTVCDSKGVRLFADSEMLKLGEKSGAALDRVFEAAQKVNKMSDEDVEDLAKNSEGGPAE